MKHPMNIPVIFQNASFGLSLFAIAASKKVRNWTGYYSLFSKRQSQKSSRPKTSILKDHGYILICVSMTILLLSSCGHKGPLYLPSHPTQGKTTR